jgi:hypothetical protein
VHQREREREFFCVLMCRKAMLPFGSHQAPLYSPPPLTGCVFQPL